MVNIHQLLFAGNETTANWLGHIAMTLAEFPDVRRDPRRPEAPTRRAGRSDALARRDAGSAARRCKAGATLAGVDLEPGTEVILLLGAAGRDPARWGAPGGFDIHREPKPHLAFGFGLTAASARCLRAWKRWKWQMRCLTACPITALPPP